MIILHLCCATCRLETQTMAPTLPYFQGIKRCVQFIASHPHETIFIFLIIMMDKMSPDLYGLGIKLKTTQPTIFNNPINMQIIIELSTEEGQFKVLYTL